jgi:hypothetical protein
MAKQTIVTFIDDLDGSDADGTIKFGLNDREYEIDLNESNAEKLRELLAPYIEAGRRTAGKARGKAGRVQVSTPAAAPARQGARTVADREQTQAIREWARKRGHEVSDRGRIPVKVLDAYHAEN